jgi:hypothetical protein
MRISHRIDTQAIGSARIKRTFTKQRRSIVTNRSEVPTRRRSIIRIRCETVDGEVTTTEMSPQPLFSLLRQKPTPLRVNR